MHYNPRKAFVFLEAEINVCLHQSLFQTLRHFVYRRQIWSRSGFKRDCVCFFLPVAHLQITSSSISLYSCSCLVYRLVRDVPLALALQSPLPPAAFTSPLPPLHPFSLWSPSLCHRREQNKSTSSPCDRRPARTPTELFTLARLWSTVGSKWSCTSSPLYIFTLICAANT